MIRALIITAVAALAVSGTASASGGGGDPIPTESISFKLKAGPPKPRGDIVVTKATDVASTKLQRGSSGSGLTHVLISGWSTRARSGKGHKDHNGGQGTVTANWDLTASAKV